MTSSFSAQKIASFCHDQAQSVAIHVVAETGSTNADLLAQLDTLTTPTLLIAEKQTAGRGRAGRVWHAAPQCALTFSLAWKFNLPMQGLLGLPLAVGVAIAQALAECDVSVQLKWPNDILKDDKKLGGVLIEAASVSKSSQNLSVQSVWVVIGIGLNLMLPDELQALLGDAATDAPSLMQKDRNHVMATLLNHLTQVLYQFEQEGFAAFTARWNALHAYADQAVVISNQGQNLHEGIARGVDGMGRLMLESFAGAGTVSVMAGDVSLRLHQTQEG